MPQKRTDTIPDIEQTSAQTKWFLKSFEQRGSGG